MGIDFDDSKALWAFGNDTVNVSNEYKEARILFAKTLKDLKFALAEAYKNGEINPSFSEDKAYIILSNKSEELKKALNDNIEAEQTYKGLEKVLDTRLALQNLYQSLIKNMRKEA